MSEVFAEGNVENVKYPKVDVDELGDEETSWQRIVNLYGMLIAMLVEVFWEIVKLRKNKRVIFCLSIVLEFFILLTTPLLLLFSWFMPKGDILNLIYKFVPSRIADTRMDAIPAPVISILLIHGSSFNWTQWMFGIFYLVRQWMRTGQLQRWRLFVVNYNGLLNLLPFVPSKKGVDDYARLAVRDKIRNDIFPGTCRVSLRANPGKRSSSLVAPQVDFATEADRQRQLRLDLAGRKPESMPQNHLILIGHGVGGLIAQEYANAVAMADGVQILGIFTLATPWFGLKLIEYRNHFLQTLSNIFFPNKLHGKFNSGPKMQMQLRQHSDFCAQMRNFTNSGTMISAHGNIKSPNDLVVEFPENQNSSISYASSTSHHPDGRILSHTDFGAHLGHYSILASPAVWITIGLWLSSIKPTTTSATEPSLLPDQPLSTSSTNPKLNTFSLD